MHETISIRHRWLLFFLWLTVGAWGIGLGAKLFELTVLIPAWAANPPQSLNLLPYGPRWPNNPGDFFQPLSAALVLATVGTLVAGWKTRPPYNALLWLSLGALILIWASTPTLFWPMIRDLYWASTGKQPLDSQAAAALTHQWIFYDWIRTALIAVGFVASLLAVSRNADAYREA
jgi:hypothetical protein